MGKKERDRDREWEGETERCISWQTQGDRQSY